MTLTSKMNTTTTEFLQADTVKEQMEQIEEVEKQKRK